MLVTGHMDEAERMAKAGLKVFEYVDSEARVRFFSVVKVGDIKPVADPAHFELTQDGRIFSLVNLDGYL